MERNLARVDLGTNAEGKTVPVPIPFNCSCGEPANYGRDDRWFCTACWQLERKPE